MSQALNVIIMGLCLLVSVVSKSNLKKTSVLPKVAQNVTIMVCAIARDEDRYFEEWLRYNKLLGFDFVHVYDNSVNASTFLERLAVKYEPFLHIEHFPGNAVQMQAYNKCIDTYRNDTTWAAFIDIDEFIVLHKHADVRKFLHQKVPMGGQIEISRVWFGSNNETEYSPEPVLSRFTTRKAQVDRYVKTIAYLPHVQNMTSPHYCHLTPGFNSVDPNGYIIKKTKYKNTHGKEDIAAVYHYHTKSLAEFKLKLKRGDAHFPDKYALYNDEVEGERQIMRRFRYAQENSTVLDTRAWDWYKRVNATANF